MEASKILEAIRRLAPADRRQLIEQLLVEYSPELQRPEMTEAEVLAIARSVITDHKELLQRLANRDSEGGDSYAPELPAGPGVAGVTTAEPYDISDPAEIALIDKALQDPCPSLSGEEAHIYVRDRLVLAQALDQASRGRRVWLRWQGRLVLVDPMTMTSGSTAILSDDEAMTIMKEAADEPWMGEGEESQGPR